ncbi:MAG: zf-HC2 domain-containing protein [Phycisphaerales bacterium]|nr:zf-HC2 domain-containing protein [Phycisphaerales bacterium]
MLCIEPEKLGRFFDGEVSETERTEIESHLRRCSLCASELADLESMRDQIAAAQTADPPTGLWESIEASLDSAASVGHAVHLQQLPGPSRVRRFRTAASIAAAVGLIGFAALWIGRGEPAQAAAIDFAVLLDSISEGAVEAFDRFIKHHSGRPVDPADARRSAPDLDFEVPADLPGGWRRARTYRLEFGGSRGIAASYVRNDGEFLATIFHAPVKKENFGTHKDYPCVVGKHRGHSVQIGEWRMVHLTDPSTCHCVLSRITDEDQLASVMSAIAPRSKPSDGHGH